MHWKITLFVIFFFPVLLKLGFWQLSRADEKKVLLTTYEQQQALPATSLTGFPTSELTTTGPVTAAAIKTHTQYQKVIVTGVYNKEHYWLLDNRSRQGQVGYEVVMPFVTDEGVLLVNRGWISSAPRRTQLPNISTPTTTIELEGYLSAPQANAVINHSKSDWVTPWPKRVLQLDLSVAEQDLNTVVYPQLLNLDHDQPSAFVTNWTIINLKPEKHQAYAIQWFTMSAVLLLLYAWHLLRSHNAESKQ